MDYTPLKNDVVFYSANLAEFEQLDFKNDALAGVRANYFNSNCQTQFAETEIFIDNFTYKLSYKLEKGMPLIWKIARNNRPYQSVKRSSAGIYCVIYYGENGVIYKQQYFDKNHFWIKTEYYNSKISDELVCEIYPNKIENIIVIEKNIIKNKIISSKQILFPSQNMPERIPDALVYTNKGMIWYDASFKPDEINCNLENTINFEKNNIGFSFEEKVFSPDYVPEKTLDFSNLEYLSEESLNNIENNKVEDTKIQDNKNVNNYSSYDEIEKILIEEAKKNKNLFGEFSDINEQIKDKIQEEIIVENIEKEKLNDDFELDKIIFAENDTNIVMPDDDFDVLEDADEFKNEDDFESTYVAQHAKENIEDEENIEILENKQHKNISVNSERYRTELENGLTAYDGEFVDGKRNGFGVFYYKNGNINYVGKWKENKRNGAGVGYRTSDGTMHIGKWSDNSPIDYGARFDKNGNFIDLAFYNEGLKNGKCISFDKNGNVVLSIWENGEKIKETIIED